MKIIGGCLLLAIALLACAAPLNYTNRDGPRYTGCGDDVSIDWNPRRGGNPGSPDTHPDSVIHFPLASPRELRVVSFNIKFAMRIDQAITVLSSDPNLRLADVVLLQEMDVPGVRRIAEALGFCWVYYPATLHPQSKRHFGNAVLSRYPIREDHKVLLPHLGQFGKTQRIAVAATLDIGGTAVRVYSVHLATTIELGPERRRNQARAIVSDAGGFEGPVLIGGDLNEKSIGEIFSGAGYQWVTRDLGRTTDLASLDHIVLRHLEPASGRSVGKSPDTLAASDHLPIWVRLQVPAAPE